MHSRHVGYASSRFFFSVLISAILSACGGGSSNQASSLEYQAVEFQRTFDQSTVEILSDTEVNELGKQLLDFSLFARDAARQALSYYSSYWFISPESWPVQFETVDCESGALSAYADYDQDRVVIRYEACVYGGSYFDGDLVYSFKEVTATQHAIHMEMVDFIEGPDSRAFVAVSNGYIDAVIDYDRSVFSELSYQIELDLPSFSRPLLLEMSLTEQENDDLTEQQGRISFETGYLDFNWDQELQLTTWVDGAGASGEFSMSSSSARHWVELEDGRVAVAFLSEGNLSDYEPFGAVSSEPEETDRVRSTIYSDEIFSGISLNDFIQDADFDLISYEVQSINWTGGLGTPVLFQQEGTKLFLTSQATGTHEVELLVHELSGTSYLNQLSFSLRSDLDRDGVEDESDPDIDGDGIYNDEDPDPYDQSVTADRDDDGIPDILDNDINGNGVADAVEGYEIYGACSLASSYGMDSNYASPCSLSGERMVLFQEALLQDGIVYIRASSFEGFAIPDYVHRWDLIKGTWLTPLELNPLVEEVVFSTALSRAHQRLYVEYDDRVGYFNLTDNSPTLETFVADSSSNLYSVLPSPAGLVVSGGGSSDYSGTWILDEFGQMLSWSEDRLSCPYPVFGTDSEQTGIYWCSFSSFMYRHTIDPDGNWTSKISPFLSYQRNDEWPGRWLVFGGEQLLFGDGKLYDADALTQVGQLEGQISAAVAIGDDQVMVARKLSVGSQLELLDIEGNRVLAMAVAGQVHALFSYEDSVVLVYERGDVGIETLKLTDDMDNDGVTNVEDAFPSDPSAAVDEDGDGYPSWFNEGYSSELSSLILDAYPLDASCYLDTQGIDGQCLDRYSRPQSIPDLYLADRNGVIYAYVEQSGSIFRWDTNDDEFLAPLQVDFDIDGWLYHPTQQRLYVWPEGNEIFSFDLSRSQPMAEHFLFTEYEVWEIEVVGNWIAITTGDSFDADNAWIVDENGKRLESVAADFSDGVVGMVSDTSLYVQDSNELILYKFDIESSVLESETVLSENLPWWESIISVSPSLEWVLMSDDLMFRLETEETVSWQSYNWDEIKFSGSSERFYAWKRSGQTTEVFGYVWKGNSGWIQYYSDVFDGYGLSLGISDEGNYLLLWTADGVVPQLIPEL